MRSEEIVYRIADNVHKQCKYVSAKEYQLWYHIYMFKFHGQHNNVSTTSGASFFRYRAQITNVKHSNIKPYRGKS